MPAPAPTLEIGRLHRDGKWEIKDDSATSRRVALAFSSETPVERFWGVEVLGHAPGECDLSRFEGGRGPLLLDHNPSQPIGVVESAEVGPDKIGRAIVRFGKSARAEEVLQDVLDGIRNNVSVGYEVKKLLQESADRRDSFRAIEWQPLEISLVSVPADATVGIGREAAEELKPVPIINQSLTTKRSNPMPSPVTHENTDAPTRTTPPPAPPAEQPPVVAQRSPDNTGHSISVAVRAAQVEAAEIIAIGNRFNMAEAAQKAVSNGVTLNDFRAQVLDRQATGQKPLEKPVTELGMEKGELRNYSLLRAISAAAKNDWSKAGLERHASEAVAVKLGREAQGFFVPYDVMTRELAASAPESGGSLVGTTHLSGSFIDLLRSRLVIARLGARLMSGLVGNVDIPKLTGGATAYWLGESDDVNESQPTTDKVTLSPKTVAAKTRFTRRLLLQSSPDVEGVVRDDLSKVLALAIDLACINGQGGTDKPTGILNMTGIGAVVGGTNGAAMTYSDIVDLETAVAASNADVGNLAYLTNTRVRGALKTTEKASGTAQFVWSDGQEPGLGMVNGYRAAVTNQVPSNLSKGTSANNCSAVIFGNWGDLLIGEWGVLDLQVDPYSSGDDGGTIVRAFQDVDVAVRHAESFAAMTDILTT